MGGRRQPVAKQNDRCDQKSIALNPNYATAHQWYGEFLADIMRFDQGIAELRKAESLDPLSPIVGSDLAVALIHAHRYEEAVSELQSILKFAPNFVPAHSYLLTAYRLAGQQEKAGEEYNEYVQLTGDTVGQIGFILARECASGRKAEAQKQIESLIHNAKPGQLNYDEVAGMYAGVGDKQDAFEYLELAYKEHSWWLVTMEVDPSFVSLRSDPRFKELVHRVGIPQ